MASKLYEQALERAKKMKAGTAANDKAVSQDKSGWDPKRSDRYNQILERVKTHGVHTGITEQDVNQFYRDVQSYASDAKSQLNSHSWKSMMDENAASARASTLEDLNNRAQRIRLWADVNKSKNGDEWHNGIVSYLDTFNRSQKEINGLFDATRDYYSQWDSEAAYDEYQKYIESDEYKLSNMNPDQLRQAQGSAAGGDIAYTGMDGKNYTWDALYHSASQKEDTANKRTEYGQMHDWGVQSSGVTNISGYEGSDYQIAVELQMVNVPYTWEDAEYMGIDRAVFDSVDKKRKYLENKYGVELNPYDDAQILADIQKKSEGEYGSRDRFKYLNEMTEDEKSVLYYIFNTQGRSAAMEWYKAYEDIYQNRYNDTVKYGAGVLGREMPVFGSAMTVATNLLSAPEYVADLIDYGTGGEKPYNTMANITSATRGGVMDNINWKIGDWEVGDFLYSGAMSMIDSKVASSLLGTGGGVLLGMSAAAQATNDAYDRGADDGHAISSGIAAGIAEMLFETISIGKLEKMKEVASPVGREIFKNFVKTAVTNCTEELATEIANIGADFVINDWISEDDFSEYSTSVRVYQNQGYTVDEAKNKSLSDLGSRVAEAGASGFLMGMGFGVTEQSGAIGMGLRNYRADTRTARGLTMSETGVQQLKDLAMETVAAEGKRNGQKVGALSERVGVGFSGKNVRNARKLLRTITDSYASQSKQDIVKSLKRKGFSGSEADALGSALAAEVTGGIIGAEESGILRKYQADPRLREVRETLLENTKSTVGQRGENLHGLRVGAEINLKLDQAMNEITAEDTAVSRLEELGETGDVSQISKAIAKATTGQKLTTEEKSILKSSKFGTQVLKELKKETTTVTAEPGDTNTATPDTMDTQTETPTEMHYEASTDGVTTQKSTGDPVKIQEVASIKNGKMTFRTEDGAEVDASDISYGTDAEAMVYEAVASLEGFIDGKSATDLANHLFKLINQGETISDTFVRGIAQAYMYGYAGYGPDSISSENTFASDLTERQRNVAYRRGMKYQQEKAAVRQQAAPKKKTAETGGEKGKSKAPDGTSYDNVRFEGKVKKWGGSRKRMWHFLILYPVNLPVV